MIVLIMGMSKSGTTLVAKTLDESGINFRPGRRGNYPACPYENFEGCELCMEQIGIDRKMSLYVPEKVTDLPEKIKNYIDYRSNLDQDWGFKFPYLTFVYPSWKKHLKKHIAIGLKRNPEGLINHYRRKKKKKLSKEFKNKILRVQKYYNTLIDSYNIPVIQFEDIINRGPVVLEKIVNRKLKDVRDGKIH